MKKQKVGGVLAIIGASVSCLPVLFFLVFGSLIVGLERLESAIDEEDSPESEIVRGVNEDGVELTSDETFELGAVLMLRAFGSLICCTITLTFGILALRTKRPLITGLVVIGCAILGTILVWPYTIVLIMSILGGILLCFVKPKTNELCDVPVS